MTKSALGCSYWLAVVVGRETAALHGTKQCTVPTPYAHVIVLTGIRTAYILTSVSFHLSARTSLYYNRCLKCPKFHFHIARARRVIFFPRLIFLNASIQHGCLESETARVRALLKLVAAGYVFSLWVNEPDLRSFFLRGKP